MNWIYFLIAGSSTKIDDVNKLLVVVIHRFSWNLFFAIVFTLLFFFYYQFHFCSPNLRKLLLSSSKNVSPEISSQTEKTIKKGDNLKKMLLTAVLLPIFGNERSQKQIIQRRQLWKFLFKVTLSLKEIETKLTEKSLENFLIRLLSFLNRVSYPLIFYFIF